MQDAGWVIVDANVSLAGGELDLIAQRGGLLRFVEVKARTNVMLDPEESVTSAKRQRLRAAASLWLELHALDFDEVAFLVVIVDCTLDPWAIEYMDDAFDG